MEQNCRFSCLGGGAVLSKVAIPNPNSRKIWDHYPWQYKNSNNMTIATIAYVQKVNIFFSIITV